MMKKSLLSLWMLTLAQLTMAQSIDFQIKNGGRDDLDLEPGYVSWAFGRVSSDTKTFAREDGGKVSITISAVTGLQTNGIQTNWWKTGIRTKGYRLVGDMVNNGVINGNGDFVNVSSGSTGLQLSVKGLAAGPHSLMAYHSNTDGYSGKVAPLDVLVNGETVAQGVAQGCRDTLPETTPYSYIYFNVEDESAATVIQYITRPEEGEVYATTTVAINALVFDRPNPFGRASDFLPLNLDYHVDADDGTLELSWRASLWATKYKVMVGVAPGEEQEIATIEDTRYRLNNLYSMNTYYWRIDEVDTDGRIYQGKEMSFRPRQLAFPGAEGYGRYATGGRGGAVYHVTNLNHDHNPGSFLYGLVDLEGPRTIVFDVSGVIDMGFESVFAEKYITIAAQTAPGKGICLKHSNLNINGEDICRFLRAKRGYGETGNAMGLSGADHAIVDHSTAAWGTDETVSGRGAKNISFQYNIIAEALGIADHKNYPSGTNHGYAATIDGRIGSWHHNLLANCCGRNWSMGGGMDGNNIAIGQMDIFNNVVYNWNTRTTDGGCHEVNFVNNYYKMGPDTKRKELFIQEYEIDVPGSTWQAYVKGNIRENKDHTLSGDLLGDTYKYTTRNGVPDPNTRNDKYQYRTFVEDGPFFESFAEIHSAKDAFKIVNSYAGAYMPCPDAQHVRVVRETVNGTYTYVGSRSGIKGEIDHENDCGGFEDYPEEHRPDDFDEDQDGIPTWYEHLVGTDPAVANHNADPDGDGWTQLEDYLEFMAHPYCILGVGECMEIDLAPYFAGFTKSPVYRVDVPQDGELVASVAGSILKVLAGSVPAIVPLCISVTDSEGSSFARRYSVAVSDEVTAIEELPTEQATVPMPVYDLWGRKSPAGMGHCVIGGRIVF